MRWVEHRPNKETRNKQFLMMHMMIYTEIWK